MFVTSVGSRFKTHQCLINKSFGTRDSLLLPYFFFFYGWIKLNNSNQSCNYDGEARQASALSVPEYSLCMYFVPFSGLRQMNLCTRAERLPPHGNEWQAGICQATKYTLYCVVWSDVNYFQELKQVWQQAAWFCRNSGLYFIFHLSSSSTLSFACKKLNRAT